MIRTIHKNRIINSVRYKLKNKFSYKEINRIISLYHNMVMEEIALGTEFNMIKSLGSLEVVKYKNEPEIVDGKINTDKLPVNWVRTFRLWKDHPELKNKQFVRCLNEHTNGYIFALKYRRGNKPCDSIIYYTFYKNNTLTKKLSNNIKEGKVDAFLGKIY